MKATTFLAAMVAMVLLWLFVGTVSADMTAGIDTNPDHFQITNVKPDPIEKEKPSAITIIGQQVVFALVGTEPIIKEVDINNPSRVIAIYNSQSIPTLAPVDLTHAQARRYEVGDRTLIIRVM